MISGKVKFPAHACLDGIYQVSGVANNKRICFGFVVEQGIIIRCAPYGYKWLWGRDIVDVVKTWNSNLELNFTDEIK
jgi:hypothetical protein